ncbi:DUF928 domain-containing protein [Dendronalium sp. ChiSLP03b]|uniref:DUF928 domain-containing protein n=1 Tax=Dendronalium sp. ChiSLP03b TaxID=3075381 RepID=UPI00391BFBD7
MTKLFFTRLSLSLIFIFTLDVYPAVKAAAQSSNAWGNKVISQQQQRQQPQTPKPTNTPKTSGFISQIIRFILPPKGAPGQRTYAAARADCPAIEKPLTALVPQTNIGLTISERPTFWFYIPYQPTNANPVEFLLINDKKYPVYKTTFQLTSTPGIINVNLPQNVPALEIGKKYNWVLSYMCDPVNRLKDTFVKGYIERVSINSNVKNHLEKASRPRERILLFAENGLWYDALVMLANERRQKPKDAQVAKDWKDLLLSSEGDSKEIKKIVSEPIVSCCLPMESR